MTTDGQQPDGSTGKDNSSEGLQTLQEMEVEALAEEPTDEAELQEKYAITEDEAQSWSGRISDARQWQGRIDKAKGELNDIQKETKGTEKEKKSEPAKKEEESDFVTKDELWEQQNAESIELYGDEEYQADVEGGVPKDKALKYAKTRYESDPDRAATERAKAMGGSGRKTNREGGEPVVLTDHDKRFGISAERKAELEKKYPHLKGAAPSPELPT